MVKITVKYPVYKVYLEDADGNLECRVVDGLYFDKEEFKVVAKEEGLKVVSVKKTSKTEKYEAGEFFPHESYREVK